MTWTYTTLKAPNCLEIRNSGGGNGREGDEGQGRLHCVQRQRRTAWVVVNDPEIDEAEYGFSGSMAARAGLWRSKD